MGWTGEVARGDREQSWRKHLVAWRESGLSQAEYCRRQRLNAVQFSIWKGRLKLRNQTAAGEVASGGLAAKPAPLFVPVRVNTATVGVIPFEVLLRTGRRVQVPTQFDPDALRRLLAVLEATPC